MAAEAIARPLPTAGRQRDRRLFDLAKELRGLGFATSKEGKRHVRKRCFNAVKAMGEGDDGGMTR